MVLRVVVSDFLPENNHGMLIRAFPQSPIHSSLPLYASMTTEPAPTVRDLMAFYLEAGVDCALGDEPIEGDIVDEPAEPDLLDVKSDLAKAMYAGINELGISDDERIPFIVSVIDRPITSTKQLTEDEARKVLAHLDSIANDADGGES